MAGVVKVIEGGINNKKRYKEGEKKAERGMTPQTTPRWGEGLYLYSWGSLPRLNYGRKISLNFLAF